MGCDNNMVRVSKHKASFLLWTIYPELHASPHYEGGTHIHLVEITAILLSLLYKFYPK